VPFVLAFIAIILIVVGVRGQSTAASKLLASEFTGASSFVPWFLAIMALGLVGYFKPIRPVADAFLGLVILAMLLANNGFFVNLTQAFETAQPSAATPPASGSTGAAPAGPTDATGQPLAPTIGIPSIPGFGSTGQQSGFGSSLFGPGIATAPTQTTGTGTIGVGNIPGFGQAGFAPDTQVQDFALPQAGII
jgi:hypothetical protein